MCFDGRDQELLTHLQHLHARPLAATNAAPSGKVQPLWQRYQRGIMCCLQQHMKLCASMAQIDEALRCGQRYSDALAARQRDASPQRTSRFFALTTRRRKDTKTAEALQAHAAQWRKYIENFPSTDARWRHEQVRLHTRTCSACCA